MSEITEMINQGGEAFVLLFLVVGALGVAVVMFIASPKKFIKSVLKDFLNSLIEKYGKKTEQEPYTPEAPEIEKPKGK